MQSTNSIVDVGTLTQDARHGPLPLLLIVLTVVTGLDPTSRILTDSYEEAVARFIDTSFSAVECVLETMLDVVPNDWNVVRARLEACGIFETQVAAKE